MSTATEFCTYPVDDEFEIFNMKKLKNLKKIGYLSSGNFGVIYKVEQKNFDNQGNSKIFALKILKRIEIIDNPEKSPSFIDDKNYSNEEIDPVKVPKLTGRKPKEISSQEFREYTICKNLNHKNIVKFYDFDFYGKDNEIRILMEYYPLNLREYFQKIRGVNEPMLKSIFFQLLSGLEYLHSKMIVHRDIKLDNIFIDDKTMQVVIGDFGLSRRIQFELENSTLTDVGTINYKPLDVLLGNMYYSFNFDIWSLGCVIASLAIGRELFCGNGLEILGQFSYIYGEFNEKMFNGIEQLENFRYVKGINFGGEKHLGIKNFIKSKAKCDLSEDFYDLIEKMLRLDPCRRISAKDALEHPWFLELR